MKKTEPDSGDSGGAFLAGLVMAMVASYGLWGSQGVFVALLAGGCLLLFLSFLGEVFKWVI